MARNQFGNRAAVAVIIDKRAIDNLGIDIPFSTSFPDNQSTTGMGINGAFTVVSNNTTCEITIRLLPNSTGNDILFELYDNQRSGFARLFSITVISDVNENLQFQNCTIKQPPDLSIGGEDVNNREWVFNSEVFEPDPSLYV